MSLSKPRTMLLVGLTAIFVGYLTVWLPGPAAGLSFIGVELGEWTKFLGVGRSRDLFYLPPITLGLALALMTIPWANDRWQTWMMRGLAVAVSLLAFPAIEAIRLEPTSEWLLRIQLILLVLLIALASGIVARKGPASSAFQASRLLMALVGIVGLALPTWAYFSIRPIVREALRSPVGIGLGVWLNGVGHLLVVLAGIYYLTRPIQGRPNIQGTSEDER